MTSEPAASPPVHAPPRPPTLAAAATLDFLLSVGAVVGLSVLVIVPIVVADLIIAGEQGLAREQMDARMQALQPTIVVAALVAMALAALLVWAVRRKSLQGHLPGPPPARAYGLAVLAGLGIQGFATLMGWLIASLGTSLAPSNAAPIQAMAEQHPWASWALVVLLAPLAEELLFRHVLLRRFALAGRPLLGLVFTSLLFAALHEPVPGAQGLLAWLATGVLYAGMGVGFGLVYLRTGRFGAAFLAHATCNLLAMGLLALSLS